MLMRPEDSGPPRLITWQEVDELIDGLIPRIQILGPFGAMVMITRGGVIPGGLLAEALSIQHLLTASVDFVATASAGLMAWPSFLQFPDPDLLRGRRTLIVDDVWGSGKTSLAVRDRVSAAGGSPFNCVLHYNPYRDFVQRHQTRSLRRCHRCVCDLPLGVGSRFARRGLRWRAAAKLTAFPPRAKTGYSSLSNAL